MNPSKSRKVAAAVAAVLQYAAEVEALPAAPAAAAAGPVSPPSPWGGAGRQEAMLLRTFWQRRLTKSW
ncbi:MAG: hypothetical protein Kow0092_19220 [Deferrisomatales bacterium]